MSDYLKKKYKLTIVGAGPGNPNMLTGSAVQAIMNAKAVYASKRLEYITGRETYPLEPLNVALKSIEEKLHECDVALIVSGDPTMFSLSRVIAAKMPNIEIALIPGIGASDALFCELGESKENSYNLSVHGRELDKAQIVAAVKYNELCTFWLDEKNNAGKICEILCEFGLEDVDVAIGYHLSYPEQDIQRGCAKDFSQSNLGENAIMRVRNKNTHHIPCSPSLRDEDFIRGAVPMTKAHVRMLSVCELALTRDSIVWDAGAGTGSVAIQCAVLCPFGKVYAIERNLEGIELIKENARGLKTPNVIAIQGDMPEALNDLPNPTHVFIGGSGGELENIISLIVNRGAGIRVVINSVTLETAAKARTLLRGKSFAQYRCMQIQGSIEGKAGIFEAKNPIYILSAITV